MTDINRIKRALEDHYALDREIGRGGMATVYLARDLKHDRKVAIKVLRPELAAHLGTERFLREVQLTANLQHPHIVAVYDSGEADGLLYYVMPYVEGESLRARLTREQQLPSADAVRIARQVATALEFAHERDVVHRDIKPENILLAGGTAMVADFGVARAAEAAGGEQLTAIGLAVGTPAYMSPEQASGDSKVDGRSDLYSLGCVLYEMLSGKAPFGGDTPQRTLARQVMEPVPSLAVAAKDVPRGVAAVVECLLAKAPQERIQSAKDLTHALDDASSDSAHQAVGSGPWWTAFLGRRAARVVAIYVAAAVLGVALTKWLVGQLALSPHLTTFVGVALLLLLPSVMLLAHRRGGDGWSVAEKVGVPANAVLAAAILFLLFGGTDLGATTTEVTLRDEEGNVITRRVPKAGFRKNVMLFFFDNPQSDTSLTWLQYGIPMATGHDLLQDLFFYVTTPEYVLERLEREGFGDGLNVPLTLQRQIANDTHFEWFLTGSVSGASDDLRVTTRLYETRRGQLLAEREFSGGDPFALVDRMTEVLKGDLDVPAAQLEDARDLPVAETLTGSLAAYRDYVTGAVAMLRTNPQAAVGPLERAVARDSLFALAHLQLFAARILANQTVAAGEALETALRLSYKLPEIYQLAAKTSHYRLQRQDPARALAVARMHAELYPHDFQARQVLVLLFQAEGEYDSVAVQLETMYGLDTTRSELLLRLGNTALVQGGSDRALQYYRRYATRFPEDPDSYEAIARASALLGDHERALQQYDRALLLDPDAVDALLGSARVSLDIGRFDDARTRLEQALGAAGTPAERADVYRALQSYHDRRGELSQAVEYMERSWSEGGVAAIPFYQLQLKLDGLGQYVRAGRVAVARDTLRTLTMQLSGPFDALLGLGRLTIAEELEDADSIEAALTQIDTLMVRFGVGEFRGERERAVALASELRGACDQAMPRYRRALELQPTLREASLGLARCERKTGQLDDATNRLQELLRQRPYHPVTLYEYALVLRDQGKRGDAVRELRKAMQVFANAEPACLWANRVREEVQRLGG